MNTSTTPSNERPLRDYAAIGDGQTVALISRGGDIDWLPLPTLEGKPVFAGILDPEYGGELSLAPAGELSASREYVPGTNVLQTTYTTSTGTARVTDSMNLDIGGQLPWVELARRVEGLTGEVDFTWTVAPGTALGSSSPWVDLVGDREVLRCDGVSIALTGLEHGPQPVDEKALHDVALRGELRTSPGSEHLLVLTATEHEPLYVADPEIVQRRCIEGTLGTWREWSEEFTYHGPWADAVKRSALTLKLLIYGPTGAVAAAATTSLPESSAGGKNWDYRYAWVRDLAYTVKALDGFGLRGETHAAISWILRTVRERGPEVEVMYSLHGGTCLDQVEQDAPGWRGIGPVVTGNRAQGQLQLGVYGDLLSIARTYVEGGHVLDIETGRLLASIADQVCDLWHRPDAGMWELPEEHHYTSSKMGCWQALQDASYLAENGHIPGPVHRWDSERGRIRAWVESNCWSERRQAYVMHPDTEALDVSVLLHARSGFDRSQRMSSTIDAITEELGAGPLLYRYSGMQEEEHTFVACAFWRVAALTEVGRLKEAEEAMEELVAATNDVGLLAEMISAEDGGFWGNLPQGLSHLALIQAALTVRAAREAGTEDAS
ncbi:glycoside hydrolase family 15 protein [Rothia halotolerans]|uniref:glycoside hydrolase family 15 protein n=1 Tax=Rothia halotolerans TaxID=405770 RepID=UPI00101BC9E5|nr:glycoside hydrolase family 15 protein [Rothia halotolerans]